MREDRLVDVPASIRARLKNKADSLGLSFDQVLQYYAMERFLFRLAMTRWVDVMVVKGAAMLRVWEGAVARPTRDIDFLGRVDGSPDSIVRMVRECLSVAVEDGLEFSSEVSVVPITLEDRYPGARVTVHCTLSGARTVLRLDVGVADVAFPAPGWVDYPTLLGTDPPRILGYRPATAIAEKVESMLEKGLLNSRVKDYYDIWMLSRNLVFEGGELRDAISATCTHRDTAIPTARPSVLDNEYADQPATRAQWASFIRRLHAAGVEAPADFKVVVEQVSGFVMPVLAAAAADEPFDLLWKPALGWMD